MALLNKEYLKTLVAIGEGDDRYFQCTATGFLVGFFANHTKNPEKQRYHVFLVTNKHVFDKKEKVSLRFNTNSGTTKVFDQDLSFPDNKKRWLAHRYKNVDLALLKVSQDILEETDINYSFVPQQVFGESKDFEELGIQVGDELYVIGFPLGIAGKLQNFSCVRWGIISRIDKEIIKDNKVFLVDANTFPGNSGGPVIYRPQSNYLSTTKRPPREPRLIGVVSGYIQYEDKLISTQTRKIVGSSLENSGLSSVVPIEYTRYIFNEWKRKRKRLEKAQNQKRKFVEN